MADTARNIADLQVLLANNTTAQISAQDLRDFLVSSVNIIETSLQTLASPLTVTGDLTATSFSGSGSSLTSLNASNLASGTVADARLTANVPLLDVANTFTGDLTIGDTGNAGTLHVKDATGTTTASIDGSDGSASFANGSATIDSSGNIAAPQLASSTASKATLSTNADTGGLQIDTGGAANKGLVIKGAASQTANLLECKNSSDTVIAAIKDEKIGLGVSSPTNFITATGLARPDITTAANGSSNSVLGAIILTGGIGGNTTGTGTRVGGNGGAITQVGGVGGQASGTTTSGTGGVGGAASFLSGAGGSQTFVTSTQSRGGAGGIYSSRSGAGGAASGSTASNIGGASGAANFGSGIGGTATGGTTATGGASGVVTISSGAGGAASDASGTNTGGFGNAVTVTLGNGGAASGGTNAYGGNVGNLSFITGYGGDASGASDSNYGGSAGSIQFTGYSGGNATGGTNAFGGNGASIYFSAGGGGTGTGASGSNIDGSNGDIGFNLNQYPFAASLNGTTGYFDVGGYGLNIGQVGILSREAGNVGLGIKGAVSQTANLTEWLDSSDTVLTYIDADGAASFASGSIQIDSSGNILDSDSNKTIDPNLRQLLFSDGITVLMDWSYSDKVILGAGASATAANNVSIGDNAVVQGDGGIAIGSSAQSSGLYSTAVGQGSSANGEGRTAYGSYSMVLADYGVAMGIGCSAEFGSLAIGNQTIASSEGSISIGGYASDGAGQPTGLLTQTFGLNSIALGVGAQTTATRAVAIGQGVSNSVADTVAIGTNATTYLTLNSSSLGSSSQMYYNNSGIFAPTAQIAYVNSGSGISHLTITASAAANKGLVLKDASGQSAAIFEYTRSDGYKMIEMKRSGDSLGGVISLYNNNAGETKLSGDGALLIDTGATAKFRLLPSGNHIYFQNTNTSGDMYFTGALAADLTGQLLFRNTGNVRFGTSGSERMSILTNGNVGIGATTPGAQLEVVASAAGTKGQIIKAAAAQSANLSEWQNSSGTVGSSISKDGRRINIGETAGAVSPPTSDAAQVVLATSSADRCRIQMTQGSNTWGIQLYADGHTYIDNDNSGGKTVWRGVGNARRVTFADNPSIMVEPMATTSKGLVVQGLAAQTANLQEWQNSSGTVLSSITASGAVMIGSSGTPVRMLDVEAATNAGAARFRYASGSSSIDIVGNPLSESRIFLNDTTNIGVANKGIIGYRNDSAASNPNSMYFATNGSTRINILNDGKVGIGSNIIPTAQFQVDGNSTSVITQIIKATSGQTVSALEIQNSAGTGLSAFTSAGKLAVGITTPISTSFLNVYPNDTGYYAGPITAIFGSAQAGTFTDNSGATRTRATLTVGSNGSGSDGVLNVYSGGQDGIIFANAGADVGIGTVSPSAKLHVVGTGCRVLIGTAATGYGGIGFETTLAASNAALYGQANSTTIGSTGAGAINMRLGNDSSKGTVTMTANKWVYQTGLFGVGVATPLAQSHVVAEASGTKASIFQGASSQTANLTEWQDSSATVLTSIDSAGKFGTFAGFADAVNIAVGTTTGTKIGTATSQKIGFYNATPVVQQATTGTSTGFTAGAGTAVNDDSTFTGGTGSTAYRLSDIVLALKNLGLIAA